jgi:glycosyltransferase involved in cell wall biosynthesis
VSVEQAETLPASNGEPNEGDEQPTAARPIISIIMPVYNEVATIQQAIERVLNCGYEVEVIVVDDGSTDGTREYLQQLRRVCVHCFFHAHNHGKGAALRLGFAAARHQIILVHDADLEYDPRDFRALLEPLLDGRADVVYGSRFLGGPHRVLFFWHYVGNKFLTLLANAFNDLNLTDMETGMKAFRRDKLASLKLNSNRFGFEPEITCKAARAGWRIYEVPISYSGRTYEQGKKISWRDALVTFAAIIYYRFMD